MTCGILQDKGLNPCLLHWWADSLPLSHQGRPRYHYLLTNIFWVLCFLSWLCPWTQSNLPAEARLFSVGTLLSHLIRQLYLFRRLGCQDVGGCAMYVDTHQVSVPADTVSCDVSRKVCLNEWGDRRWPMLIFKAWHKLLCSLFHCFSLYLYNCEPFTPCVPLFRFKLVFRYWYHAMELPWWLRW